MNLHSQNETSKRLRVIKEIDCFVKESNLSGLLVTGSLAWGKNYAVTKDSDIDFYLLAPSSGNFKNSIESVPMIPKDTIANIKAMLKYSREVDTISIKTTIGSYYGAIYMFNESSFINLCKQLNGTYSKFFTNLRQNNKIQTKQYISFSNDKTIFATSVTQFAKSEFWIRKDPLFLFKGNKFYGSIFLSHLLFGEIYTDKSGTIHSMQVLARKYLKSLLPKQKDQAYLAFQNYLPRIERMNKKTIKALFESIWKS